MVACISLVSLSVNVWYYNLRVMGDTSGATRERLLYVSLACRWSWGRGLLRLRLIRREKGTHDRQSFLHAVPTIASTKTDGCGYGQLERGNDLGRPVLSVG